MELRLRPRFSLCVDLSTQEVMERFEKSAQSDATPFEISLFERQVEMTVPEERRHFWSPYLKLRIRSAQQGTELHGVFGPNINVWSMFLAGYAVVAMSGVTGLIIGISQFQIGQYPGGLWLMAGCLLLALLIWIAGKIGRRWAHDQTVDIHRFVHQSFSDVIGHQ